MKIVTFLKDPIDAFPFFCLIDLLYFGDYGWGSFLYFSFRIIMMIIDHFLHDLL